MAKVIKRSRLPLFKAIIQVMSANSNQGLGMGIDRITKAVNVLVKNSTTPPFGLEGVQKRKRVESAMYYLAENGVVERTKTKHAHVGNPQEYVLTGLGLPPTFKQRSDYVSEERSCYKLGDGSTTAPALHPKPPVVEATKPPHVNELSGSQVFGHLKSLLLNALDAIEEAIEYAEAIDKRNADVEAGIALIAESIKPLKRK
jgi:hypothetical protein